MRHTVHVMFGKAFSEALLSLNKYVMKYGNTSVGDYFNALLYSQDLKGNIEISKSILLENNKEHFVPFETKILVRHSHHHNWQPALFGYMLNDDSVVIVGGLCYSEFIPYLGNEDKLGKVTK